MEKKRSKKNRVLTPLNKKLLLIFFVLVIIFISSLVFHKSTGFLIGNTPSPVPSSTPNFFDWRSWLPPGINHCKYAFLAPWLEPPACRVSIRGPNIELNKGDRFYLNRILTVIEPAIVAAEDSCETPYSNCVHSEMLQKDNREFQCHSNDNLIVKCEFSYHSDDEPCHATTCVIKEEGILKYADPSISISYKIITTVNLDTGAISSVSNPASLSAGEMNSRQIVYISAYCNAKASFDINGYTCY